MILYPKCNVYFMCDISLKCKLTFNKKIPNEKAIILYIINAQYYLINVIVISTISGTSLLRSNNQLH